MKTNIEYHELVLQNLPQSYAEWFQEEKKYLQKHVPPHAKTLEVGCGDGRSIYDLLPITQNITGIDYDEKAVHDAKKHFANYSSVKIIQADARALPFEDTSFDCEICMTTFANFADQKFGILQEMKRVLSDDGKIIISVFSEDSLSERLKIYEKIGLEIKKILGGTVVFDESVGANISEQFNKSELEEIFTQAGLHIDDIKKVGIAYLCTLSKHEKQKF